MEIKAKVDLGEELAKYIDNQIDMKTHKKFETLGTRNFIPKSEVALTKDELSGILNDSYLTRTHSLIPDEVKLKTLLDILRQKLD